MVIAVALILSVFLLVGKFRDVDGVILGFLLAFPVAVTSRYYWVMWFLLMLTSPSSFKSRINKIFFDASVVALLPLYYFLRISELSQFETYTVLNLYIVVCIFFFAAMLVPERAFSESTESLLGEKLRLVFQREERGVKEEKANILAD